MVLNMHPNILAAALIVGLVTPLVTATPLLEARQSQSTCADLAGAAGCAVRILTPLSPTQRSFKSLLTACGLHSLYNICAITRYIAIY